MKVPEGHLKLKPPVIAERFKFHYWNQKEGETVKQYIAALHKLIAIFSQRSHTEEAAVGEESTFPTGLQTSTQLGDGQLPS